MRMTSAELAAYEARRQAATGKLPPGDTAAARLREQTERELHEQILAECRRRGWICFHGSMAHATRRTIGEPDFTILADAGRTLLVEAKSRSGKLRPEQAALAAWARKLGHHHATVRTFQEFADAAEAVQSKRRAT